MKNSLYIQSGYIFKLSERLLLLTRPEGKSSGSGHNWPLRVRTPSLCDRRETALPPAVRTGVSSARTTRVGSYFEDSRLLYLVAELLGSVGPKEKKFSFYSLRLCLPPAQAVRSSCKIRVLYYNKRILC